MNQVDNVGMTPLIEATRNNCTELVKVLLKWGANVNHMTPRARTPVPKFVMVGPNVNSATVPPLEMLGQNPMGGNALHMAIQGRTALHFAAERSRDCVSILYAAGGTIDAGILGRNFVPQFVLDDQQRILPLTGLCRRTIRTLLLSPTGGNHMNLITAVPQLLLPNSIKNFLLYYMDI